MTKPQFVVRQALPNDLDTVMALLRERIEWLRARGSDQWSTWETWRAKIEPAVEEGNVWLLFDGTGPVGTITVEFRGDRDFWTPDECAEPAAYLSKLAVRLDHAGHELGVLLTDWASDYAYRRGCKFVRLDAWKTNNELHAYYANRGWKFLRTVDTPGRNSGSLFQLPVRPMRRAQRAQLHEEDLAYIVLANMRSGPESHDLDLAGNWHANHVHRGGMRVQYTALERQGEAMFVDFMRYRLRPGPAGWQLDAVDRHFTDWRYQGAVLVMNAQLNQDSTHIVTHQELPDSCRMVVAPVPAELATACAQRPRATNSGER